MMALVSLHLIEPGVAAPMLTRLADTIIGAAIAHLFSYVWPSWELSRRRGSPSGCSRAPPPSPTSRCDAERADQDYRLARKDLIEAVAALSDSAARMGGEPRVGAARARGNGGDADRRQRVRRPYLRRAARSQGAERRAARPRARKPAQRGNGSSAAWRPGPRTSRPRRAMRRWRACAWRPTASSRLRRPIRARRGGNCSRDADPAYGTLRRRSGTCRPRQGARELNERSASPTANHQTTG